MSHSIEAPINSVGTATTVSVSNSTWTKVPTTPSLVGRTGIVVSVPSTNTANVVGVLTVSTSGPTEATTVRPFEIEKGNSFALVPAADNVYLYLLSLHSGAESVHVQEVKQRT
jgi:hypothetical protein